MSVSHVTTGAGRDPGPAQKSRGGAGGGGAGAGGEPADGAGGKVQPVCGRGNLSSDGTMILVRGEGWKELKLAAISQVEVTPADTALAADGRRGADAVVRLTQHSYVGGLWDPDTFAPYQYAEGLRRRLHQAPVLTSANDGAPWMSG